MSISSPNAVAQGAFLACLAGFNDETLVRETAKMVPAAMLKRVYGIKDPNNLSSSEVALLRRKMQFGAMVSKGSMEKRIVRQLEKGVDVNQAVNNGLDKFAHSKGKICGYSGCDPESLEKRFYSKTDVKMMFCARCRIKGYCSKECQRADWPKHRVVCKAPELKE